MESSTSSSPFSSSTAGVPQLGGVTIQLSPSLREDLIKSRQKLQQQQQQQEKYVEKTAVLHTLTSTTVRTSLAAIKLAAASSSSTAAGRERMNMISDGFITWKQDNDDDEAVEEEEEVDEYKLQYEKELDEEIVSAPPFSCSLPESSDEESIGQNPLDSSSSSSSSYGSDDMSLSPPSCFPLLVISLEKLCGYIPQTIEDYLQQKKQVEEALYGTSESSTKEDSALSSIHFSNHASELFELGIAFHSDTITTSCSNGAAPHDTVTVLYPEYILVNTKYCDARDNCSGDDGNTQLQKVSTMWKYILRSHPIPVVEHLFQYLRICNRDIQWKYHMVCYLRNVVVKRELSHMEQKRKLYLMQEFKQRRANELEKLYETRDVFERLLEDASDKLHTLEWQRQKSNKTVDLASETFDFLVQQPQEQQEQFQDDSSGSLDEQYIDGLEHDDDLPTSKSNEKQLGKPNNIFSESTVQSTEELHTEALVRTWRKRLAKIDDLIESMQDDQWAEEEEEEEHKSKTEVEIVEQDSPTDQLSLLDQILAMIMGKLTPPINNSDDPNKMEEHFQTIVTEHQTIVKEWKEYFGRLPPPAEVEEARQKSEINKERNDENISVTSFERLSIHDKDYTEADATRRAVDHWEDLLEVPEDDVDTSTRNSVLKQQKGLRPGGKIQL